MVRGRPKTGTGRLCTYATGKGHDAVTAQAMYDAIEAECPALAESCRRARQLWKET